MGSVRSERLEGMPFVRIQAILNHIILTVDQNVSFTLRFINIAIHAHEAVENACTEYLVGVVTITAWPSSSRRAGW